MKVTVICDRCKRSIEGLQTDVATGGFYKTEPGQGWHKYVHDETERIICDSCMHSSPKYQADYGDVRTIPRRNRLDLNTPAELAIRAAIDTVEEVGAHPLLTDAVVLLDQAREKVADYVDAPNHS